MVVNRMQAKSPARYGLSILALCLGIANVLAFAPFSWWFVAPLSLSGLFTLWHFFPRHAFGIGWWFGVGQFGFGTFWIYYSLSTFGNMPWWMAGAMVVLFVLGCGFWVGLAGAVYRRFAKWSLGLWVVPSLWVMSELIREWAFTGFPWLAQGYSQVGSFGQNIAAVGGVYSLSLFVVLGALMLTNAFIGRVGAAVTAATFLAIMLFTGYMTPKTQPHGELVEVRLVQANINPIAKWQDPIETINVYKRISGEVQPDQLVIWPETSVPFTLNKIKPPMIPNLPEGSGLIFGVIDRVSDTEEYNSVVGYGAAKGKYHKEHLVPFGEYLPFRKYLAWVLDYLHLPFSDISAGTPGQSRMSFGDNRIGVVICYEDAFSEFTRKSAIGSDFLITTSEEAWFGPSFAAYQRLQIAQMRAIENGRDVVRASNSGLSAVISREGEVKAVLPMFERGSLDSVVQPYSGQTAFSQIGTIGIKLIIAFWFLIIWVGYVMRGKNTL